jgi:threonine/homoserine/homoserine lactone efflux protein
MTHVGTFFAVAIVVIVIPGQDMALTLRNTLRGRRAGMATCFGVTSGLVVWAAAASVGLAALLAASEPVFLALRLVGAAYLLFLGTQALYSALRRRRRGAAGTRDAEPLAPVTAYRQGLLSNLGNPKIAVFFTSFLPQFTTGGRGAFSAMLVLGLAFCALTLLWLVVYASAIARVGDLLQRPVVRRIVDAVTGVVLSLFGVRIALERR